MIEVQSQINVMNMLNKHSTIYYHNEQIVEIYSNNEPYRVFIRRNDVLYQISSPDIEVILMKDCLEALHMFNYTDRFILLIPDIDDGNHRLNDILNTPVHSVEYNEIVIHSSNEPTIITYEHPTVIIPPPIPVEDYIISPIHYTSTHAPTEPYPLDPIEQPTDEIYSLDPIPPIAPAFYF